MHIAVFNKTEMGDTSKYHTYLSMAVINNEKLPWFIQLT